LRNSKESRTKKAEPSKGCTPEKVLLGPETNQSIRGRAVSYLKLDRELREGLKRQEFELHFQPIVRLHNYDIAGFEALLRWHSPEMGFANPGQFISTAEDSGLIVPIGLWVLEHACHVLQRFQARFNRCFPELPPLFMSVNVCARQLRVMRDVENMASTIMETGIQPEQLKLEITEGILVEDPVIAAAGLAKLKEIGVSLAIDDFGTGYSSLSYLNRFPLDTLKIDRSFVSSMLNSASSLKIVQAVAALAQELEMDIVAEGIEEPEEAHALSGLGCEYAQGYLFSRPKPLDQTMDFLDAPAAWYAHVENLGLK
jgi:EAL domain-containing protein (putative c-di-GMP-specific phosphodiesterase class I)